MYYQQILIQWKQATKKVLEKYVRKTRELVHIVVGGEKIVSTADHPYFVVGRGFVNAGQLCIGSPLQDANGKILEVEQIYKEYLEEDEEVTVYNFQVEDWHTYHVGEMEVLVHNAGPGYESGSKADVLAQNRANGRAFEQQEFAKFSSQNNNAVEQITVKTSSGVRTRVDAIGLDANGNVVINEYKSSINAPLTNNQTRAFPEIFESGGVVVGKGKGIFTGGYQIPAGTEVTIVRPN